MAQTVDDFCLEQADHWIVALLIKQCDNLTLYFALINFREESFGGTLMHTPQTEFLRVRSIAWQSAANGFHLLALRRPSKLLVPFQLIRFASNMLLYREERLQAKRLGYVTLSSPTLVVTPLVTVRNNPSLYVGYRQRRLGPKCVTFVFFLCLEDCKCTRVISPT